MTLPSFNAEQSLYRSRAHYRASALASAVGGIRPSDIPPPGSYQNSCLFWYLDPNTGNLCGRCLDQCGGFVDGPCIPADCASDIANCNGYLTCGSCSF